MIERTTGSSYTQGDAWNVVDTLPTVTTMAKVLPMPVKGGAKHLVMNQGGGKGGGKGGIGGRQPIHIPALAQALDIDSNKLQRVQAQRSTGLLHPFYSTYLTTVSLQETPGAQTARQMHSEELKLPVVSPLALSSTNSTVASPANMVPRSVTSVPPIVGPRRGVTALTVGI